MPADVDIIIPTFGQEILTAACLRSIRKYTESVRTRIVWVDNGSSEDSRKVVMEELVKHEQFLPVLLPEPAGFIRAVNTGLEKTEAPFALILNNDTEVTPWWLNRLLFPFSMDSTVAASGPLTSHGLVSWQAVNNVAAGCRYPAIRSDLPLYPDIPDLPKDNGGISDTLKKALGKIYTTVDMLAFFCTCLRMDVVRKIGFLDESFGAGYGDDDDYCQRIIAHGYKNVLVPSAFVHHHHHATFSKSFDPVKLKEMKKRNLRHYRLKHPSPVPCIRRGVSLIIPARKAADYLENCFASVRAQTVRPGEILVGIDNCPSSEEKAVSLISRFPDINIRVFSFSEHVGCYRVRNSLACASSFNILMFFDADDIMDSVHVEKMLSCPPGIAHGHGRLKDSGKSFLTAHGVLRVDRSLFFNMCGFEPWMCAADTEFLQRALQRNIKIYRPDNPTFTIGVSPSSLTRDKDTGHGSAMRSGYKKKIAERKIKPVQLSRLSMSLFKEHSVLCPDIMEEFYPAHTPEKPEEPEIIRMKDHSAVHRTSAIAPKPEIQVTEVFPPSPPSALSVTLVVCAVRIDERRIFEWFSWNDNIIRKPDVYVILVTDSKCAVPGERTLKMEPPVMKHYSPAKSSNRGIRAAVDRGAAFIIKTDIDCLFKEAFLEKVIRQGNDRLIAPACRFARDLSSLDVANIKAGPCGIVGMSSQLWRRLGGYNENMLGYGYEDGDLLKRAARCGIKVDRPDQLLWHIEHPARLGTAWYPVHRRENKKIGPHWNNPNWGLG